MNLGIGLGLTVPRGGADFTALRDLRTHEWQFGEAAATSDAAPTVSSNTLARANNPGVTAPVGGRTFVSASSQQFSVAADAALACVARDFSLSVNWKAAGPFNATKQIVTCRNNGSGDADLTYIVRYENGTLKILIGMGSASQFSSHTVSAVLTDTNQHHLAFSYDAATKALRWRLDGAAVDSATTTFAPGNLPGATPKLGVGGLGAEYFDGTVYRLRLYSGVKLTDAQLLQDYQDALGV